MVTEQRVFANIALMLPVIRFGKPWQTWGAPGHSHSIDSGACKYLTIRALVFDSLIFFYRQVYRQNVLPGPDSGR